MNLDYWRRVVLKAIQDGTYHSAGQLCKQYDCHCALLYLIENGYVDIYGASFQEARLTLTHKVYHGNA